VPVEFHHGRSDESPGRELFAELDALLDAQYPGRAQRPGSVTTPDELAAPHGVFLVGHLDGRVVAIGGVRRLTDGIGEIKRMYVVPDARSKGIGRALLQALEDAARKLGYDTVRLDAGAAQEHSRALFAATGYHPIPPYNSNHIAVYFGEKHL